MRFCRLHIYIYLAYIYIYDFHVQRKNKEVSQFTTSSFTGEITDLYPSEDKERGHGADAAVPKLSKLLIEIFHKYSPQLFDNVWHIFCRLGYADNILTCFGLFGLFWSFSPRGSMQSSSVSPWPRAWQPPWRTASATPCEVPPRALVFWHVKAPAGKSRSCQWGKELLHRYGIFDHFCRYHVHWNNL